jgi:putative pyruvate formate lyase activating enzyme
MNKIYVADGNCIFHDPGPEMLPVLLGLNPNFQIMSIRPGNDFRPKFQALRERDIHLEGSPLEHEPSYLLEAINNKKSCPDKGDRYSALDILYAVSLMALKSCSLCGWNCGINRFMQEKGRCGLGSTVFGSKPFIHIAEESTINPSLVTNFGGGCALHCKYCIEHELLNANALAPLDPHVFWAQAGELIIENGRNVLNSIEFTNPTENIHGAISLFLNAPAYIWLPVVMNAHLYGSALFYQIADLITDVWLMDLRYGNNDCARSLSGVEGYVEQALIGLNAICKKGNRVIVRILVLPGHVSCCHEPSLELLANYKEFVWVSILDQYVPEYEAHLDPQLARRPTREEVESVETMVEKCGFRNISSAGKDFWMS